MNPEPQKKSIPRAALRVFTAAVLVLCGLSSLLSPHPAGTPVTAVAAAAVPFTASAGKIIDVSKRYTYSTLTADLTKLQKAYPSLIKTGTIGNSAAGRKIPYFKLGKGTKNVLVVASLHAREHITSKYIMLCAAEYCNAFMSESGKYGNYDMKALLMKYTVFIVPNANPDGLEIVANGKSPTVTIPKFSRSNYKANARGVDLNRNFPLGWSQLNNGTKAPANAFYKGKTAGSEPETKALISLCKKYRFDFVLSFHITGECVFWGDTYRTTYNDTYKTFAKKITNVTGFYLPPPTADSTSYGGGFENWFRHLYNKPGLCIELVHYNYTTSPTTNNDFKNFSSVVKWNVSRYILPAAMT